MKRQTSGKCEFCSRVFSKLVMTNHLKSCKERRMSILEENQKTKIFHIGVEGRYLPEYWMHLEVPATLKLKELDHFLRNVWLECCGHLSAFTIQGIRYEVMENEPMEVELMDIPLDSVINRGTKFDYEYDFGTTTELVLKVLSERKGESGSIEILARNDPPLLLCNSCRKNATQVCAVCIDEGKGWNCDKCAVDHECGEEMLLPIVNSPRVGMCGYTGE